MGANDLAIKIHQILCTKIESQSDEDAWLRLLKDVEEFCRTASESEMDDFRAKCYGCEMFARIAKGIESSRAKELANEQRQP